MGTAQRGAVQAGEGGIARRRNRWRRAEGSGVAPNAVTRLELRILNVTTPIRHEPLGLNSAVVASWPGCCYCCLLLRPPACSAEWFDLVDDDGSRTLEHHELLAALKVRERRGGAERRGARGADGRRAAQTADVAAWRGPILALATCT